MEFFISKNENYTDQLTLEEFIDLQPEIIETKGYEKEERNFQDEEMEFLAGACENEFSEDEMLVLYDLIQQIVPYDGDYPNGVQCARYDYLLQQYHNLNLQANKRKINNRFSYLKK